jgi:hypothetical protein
MRGYLAGVGQTVVCTWSGYCMGMEKHHLDEAKLGDAQRACQD